MAAGTAGAPHGRLFYLLVGALSLAGGLFFAVASSGDATEGEFGWRVAFGLPAVMFFFGAVQAAERLFWPERARARAAGLSAATRATLFWGRWIVLGVAFAGVGVTTVTRHFVSPAAMDVCDDLRVLCWTLVFAGFCLADAIGERTLDVSKLVERVAPAPPTPRRPRRRRSGLTVQDGSR